MLATLTMAALLALPQEPPPVSSPEPSPSAAPAPEPTPRAEGATAEGRSIEPPRKVKDVAPRWPAAAARAGLNGVVVLACIVDPEGHVTEATPQSGPRVLAEAAVEAVRKWEYTPTMLDGRAVPVHMTVTVTFRLSRAPQRDDVMRALKDKDADIRWAAVNWLGRYRPIEDRQRKALTAMLEDPDDKVKTAAREALKRLEAK